MAKVKDLTGRKEQTMSNFIHFVLAYTGFALVVMVVYGRRKR